MPSPAYNHGVPHLPYYTPKHLTSPGTPTPNTPQNAIPTLFTPLTIRGTTLRNRIIVAPMCQYSTASSGPTTGALTDYHIATLGHYALKGAALIFIEATGVQANGRISPNCPGLWTDAQIPALARIADFVKSQGALCGIQLAHAGRKAREIEELVRDWAAAAQRAVRAGVDVIEIHAAHGYLLHQFLSPVSNQRTDRYGGSFENRVRLLVEIITAIRGVIPEGMPLYLRISSTDWMEETDQGKKFGSWDVESSIRLAKMLPGLGVDLLDVSSGGNHPDQRINMFDSKDYQIKIAAQIRNAIKQDNQSLFIGAVGLITEAEQARNIVQEDGAPAPKTGNTELAKEAEAAVKVTEGKEPMADVVLVARQFMREPEWVLKVAWQLGLDVAWPNQFLRVRFPKL
ncbi:NADPH dehydrogenase [Pyrenophora tritici-repentis Pt-1C-BFP]|uniref:NADPH dehydrogenase n=1 Tax=Pyrenophora tritici-repentis (strain Pt-1C-BFP) TaxID=426418 RepID=B2WND6_PYRTR|nr:NADPH dehydrogenase [Pyrenophora tritici-repentis Pt-1C-BFP]EDU44443.1 NADPH dehydrogenase [Pyrenophora tritici-repentis Pt-1C-BFP]